MRTIDLGNTDTLIASAKKIREHVFVQEQGIDPEREYDELDPVCVHIVAFEDGEAVSTARLRPVGDDEAKVERVATIATFRGRGIARDVMKRLEEEAARTGIRTLKLGAQLTALSFYEELGYEAYGDMFLDADLPHRMMKKQLNKN